MYTPSSQDHRGIQGDFPRDWCSSAMKIYCLSKPPIGFCHGIGLYVYTPVILYILVSLTGNEVTSQ